MNKDRFLRTNERIRFSPVAVIDEGGINLGSMPTQQARLLAEERNLDLVEINPSSRPPICKLMDYGKFKYDLAKKEKHNREKQKESELKEIRLTAKISNHDIEYKARQAREFFDRGNKVKVSMRLRGRENAFVSNALEVFNKFAGQAGFIYERTPVKAGNQITVMVLKATDKESDQNEAKDNQGDRQTS